MLVKRDHLPKKGRKHQQKDLLQPIWVCQSQPVDGSEFQLANCLINIRKNHPLDSGFLGTIQSTPWKSSRPLKPDSPLKVLIYTLPETNIAPENRPSKKEPSIPTIQF